MEYWHSRGLAGHTYACMHVNFYLHCLRNCSQNSWPCAKSPQCAFMKTDILTGT